MGNDEFSNSVHVKLLDQRHKILSTESCFPLYLFEIVGGSVTEPSTYYCKGLINRLRV